MTARTIKELEAEVAKLDRERKHREWWARARIGGCSFAEDLTEEDELPLDSEDRKE
jgi:hypothetical protein